MDKGSRKAHTDYQPHQGGIRRICKKDAEALETALEIDPEFVPALLSLGRWHVGIIARVGSMVARVTFKAKKKDAIQAFEKALELAPDMKLAYWITRSVCLH